MVMDWMDLAAKLLYYSALGQVAPVGSLLRAGARKAARAAARAARRRVARRVAPDETVRAAWELGRAPSWFEAGDGARGRLYVGELGGQLDRVLAAGRRAAAGEVEVFGRTTLLHWHDDPLSGRSFSGTQPSHAFAFEEDGRDPKGPWEIARMGHLLTLGTAARLAPVCADAMCHAYARQVRAFAACNPMGVGLHWCSPLEASIRVIHLIAAFQLLGGTARLGAEGTAELAELLLQHGHFI